MTYDTLNPISQDESRKEREHDIMKRALQKIIRESKCKESRRLACVALNQVKK